MADDNDKGLSVVQINAKPSELETCMADMQRNLPMLKKYQRLQASVIWERYNALVAEGFTANQAVELCRGSF
jgi:hypothetical protein